MSGGAFEYRDGACEYIAESIEHAIRDNGKMVDGWQKPDYSPETLFRMRLAAHLIRLAGNWAHDVDWLLSGDTGEDTFAEDFSKHFGDAKCAILSHLAGESASSSRCCKGCGRKTSAP
jgi:hypothetical protein